MVVDVWVLQLGHSEDGVQVRLFCSRGKAIEYLHKKVEQDWDANALDAFTGLPETDIRTYYDFFAGDLWYGITTQQVDIPLDLPDDEVCLDEQELKMIVCGLCNTPYHYFCETVGLEANSDNVKRLRKTLQHIVEKLES